MVNMPVLQSVWVWDYGLYPGLSDGDEAIEVDLSRGITLVLGANGIGKSTFVSLLFRMLTGPFDIPGADSDNLGRASLQVRELSTRRKHYFADRVNDGAREAQAQLKFSLGDDTYMVTRSLRDLSLISAERPESANAPYEDESSLQQALSESAGVGSFSDWILLLRYVIFYQEDRRALIWDAAAQRQVLRPLFLPPQDSNSWVSQERKILQLDSERRNLSAVVFRTTAYLKQQETKSSSSEEVLSELRSLENGRAELLAVSEEETDRLVSADKERKASRLAYLLAENALEDSKRGYEHVKLAHISNALPDQSSSARYIIAQLVSSGVCVACGQEAADYMHQIEHRLETGLCPLCGQDQQDSAFEEAASLDERRLEEALADLHRHSEQVEAAQLSAEGDDREYRAVLDSSREHRYDLSRIEERIAELRDLLPEASEEMQEAEAEQRVLKRRLARLDAELEEMRKSFEAFVEEMTGQILTRAVELEGAFSRYASAFLIEENKLTYSPLAERVGQTGASVPFPHFGLTMSGNDFASPTARSSSESVSESQREFIDLAFRMALVSVASADAAGTLVIDSPDSSLDAVFEPKAAEVLNEYASSSHLSRLVLTSNLSSGRFLPNLVTGFREHEGSEPGLVDMFDVAAPTAAVRRLQPEYQQAKAEMFVRAGLNTPAPDASVQ